MLLFLGSGVSLLSGLPGVVEITNQILNGSYYRDLDDIGQYYSSGDENHKRVESMQKVQQLLHFLMQVDKYYLESIAHTNQVANFTIQDQYIALLRPTRICFI